VQHGRGEVAAHALTERQLPDGRLHEAVEVEQFAEGREILPVAIVGHVVDRAQQLERLDQR